MSTDKEKMTEMIKSFENRNPKIFKDHEYREFEKLAIKTFEEKNVVGEIKENSFSTFYYVLNFSFHLNEKKLEKYTNLGLQQKNPFYAYMRVQKMDIVDIVDDFGQTLDLCELASCIDNGRIYWIISERLRKSYDMPERRYRLIETDCLNNEEDGSFLAEKYISLGNRDVYIKMVRLYYTNSYEMQEYYFNMGVDNPTFDSEDVYYVLKKIDFYGIQRPRILNYLNAVMCSDSLSFNNIIIFIEKYLKYGNLLNLAIIFDYVDRQQWDLKLDLRYNTYFAKSFIEVIREAYVNNTLMGKNTLYVEHEHANIALACYFADNRKYELALEYCVAISNQHMYDDDIFNVVRRCGDEELFNFITDTYLTRVDINTKDVLGTLLCKDVFNIVVEYM
jgi:hypothetical protein